MPDLTTLNVADVLSLTEGLQALEEGAGTVEEAAARIARYLYDVLESPPVPTLQSHPPVTAVHSAGNTTGNGSRACALVRVYRTRRYRELDLLRRGFALNIARGISCPRQGERAEDVNGVSSAISIRPRADLDQETVCLTLLATAGDEPHWNDRARSLDHQAIPLLSEEIVHQMPMIAQLILQLGFRVSDILQPSPNLFVNPERRTHNVFWVPEAKGCPFIPAQQDFVSRYGIRSVVGFGGALTGGELFATILFSRVHIPQEQARRFSSLAVTVRGILTACGKRDPSTSG